MGGVVWIAGYPESGTKMLQALLHSAVLGTPESGYVDVFSQPFFWEADAQWYESKLPGSHLSLSHPVIAAARPQVQQWLSEQREKSLFITNHNCLGGWHKHALVRNEVTAAALYVVRNPLDIAVSLLPAFGDDVDQVIAHMANKLAIIDSNVDFVPEVVSSWSQHVSSWTAGNSPHLHVVRFEDLFSDTKTSFDKILSFMNVTLPENRLVRTYEQCSLERLLEQEQSGGFRAKRRHEVRFFQTLAPGAWRERFSEAQIRQIVDVHRAEMALYNYVPEGY